MHSSPPFISVSFERLGCGIGSSSNLYVINLPLPPSGFQLQRIHIDLVAKLAIASSWLNRFRSMLCLFLFYDDHPSPLLDEVFLGPLPRYHLWRTANFFQNRTAYFDPSLLTFKSGQSALISQCMPSHWQGFPGP